MKRLITAIIFLFTVMPAFAQSGPGTSLLEIESEEQLTSQTTHGYATWRIVHQSMEVKEGVTLLHLNKVSVEEFLALDLSNFEESSDGNILISKEDPSVSYMYVPEVIFGFRSYSEKGKDKTKRIDYKRQEVESKDQTSRWERQSDEMREYNRSETRRWLERNEQRNNWNLDMRRLYNN